MGCCASDTKLNLQNTSNSRVLKMQNKIPKRKIPDL